MRLVIGQDDLVARWVSERLGRAIWPPYSAIGATRDGANLCAGVVLNNWQGVPHSSVEMTLASERGLSRSAINAVYNYAFDELKVSRVTAFTRRSNKTMRKLLPRFGFEFEAVVKRYYGPDRADDAFMFALFPYNARKFHGLVSDASDPA